jgi:hypothetical protein
MRITFDNTSPTPHAGIWVNEMATPVGTTDGSDYFEGTASELADRFGGHVVKVTGTGVRLAVPCGHDCLKREGCWTYRTFYPM